MEERFKYIHFKSEFFYNLLILNPSNYIKLIKIQITVNVSSKRRLGQDPTKYQGRLKVISDDFALYAYPYLLRILKRVSTNCLNPKFSKKTARKKLGPTPTMPRV